MPRRYDCEFAIFCHPVTVGPDLVTVAGVVYPYLIEHTIIAGLVVPMAV